MQVHGKQDQTRALGAAALRGAGAKGLGAGAIGGTGGGGGFESLLADAARDPAELVAQIRADAAPGQESGAEVGKQFEELLATQLVHEMRRSLSEGFFGSGAGADTYDSWLEEHIGKAMARGGDFGISNTVQSQLVAQQQNEARLAAEAAAEFEAAQQGSKTR